MLAADYPFLDILWTMIIFFAWVIWIWILITILVDVFRRHDVSGWSKALWVVFLILLPFLGVLIYLIVNGKGMAERNARQAQENIQAAAAIREVCPMCVIIKPPKVKATPAIKAPIRVIPMRRP